MAQECGVAATAKTMGVSHSTVERNCRRYRSVAGISKKISPPKILLLDIETTPMEVYVWGLSKNDYISPTFVLKDYNVICYSAKWLFDSKMMHDVQTPKEARKRDDKRVTKSIYALMDEADIIIGHNVDRFDDRKLKARFVLNGFPPLSPYRNIDTYKIAKQFGFSSNKLDYLGKLIIRRQKIKTDFDLWKRCLAGDKDALKEMSVYCDGDVALLEDIYLFFRGWMKSHPNLGVWDDSDGESCPVCLSKELEDNGKYMSTNTNLYASKRCKKCGAYSRVPTGVIGTKARKKLLRSIPR